MLATLTHDHFSDPDWIYERKLDGERCLAFRDGDRVRLLSRNRKQLNDSYPELEEAVAGQPENDFVIDGEIVAFSGNVTSFQRLQARMQVKDRDQARASGVAVHLYVFDILHLDGQGTEKLPLRARKGMLKRALDFGDRLRFTVHRNESGEAWLEEACRRGWEGLIAKDAAAPYVHSRSKKWLKFKCGHQQELVIGGYTEPEGDRTGFGALLLGYHDDGELVYAGKVGTGFDDDTLRRLGQRLASRERSTPPYDRGQLPSKGVHWVRPDLVAEVGFTEWTSGGRLRHPRFLGLRWDKDAEDVVREDRS
ncbi:MAG TPA: non-homologous end-joining DNA ligase [Methylomirabilota bacterium]|nr:non-homologous end-joining DNA ligase [Methylomirabilota bacterium]